jgi:hypothetical protein
MRRAPKDSRNIPKKAFSGRTQAARNALDLGLWAPPAGIEPALTRFRNLWPHTEASGFPPAPSPSDLRLFIHHPVSLDVTNGHSVPPVWVQVGYRPVRNLAHRRVRTSQAHAFASANWATTGDGDYWAPSW